MTEFWIICAWDNYYPDTALGNIKAVVEGTYEDAVSLLEKIKSGSYERDHWEIFCSDELPWIKE